MSNKKLGNQFETEFCEILAEEGFWCHNMAQNSAGQPADVIAAKDGVPYLIDCKVCTNDIFKFDRIEENQSLAMELWHDCGNGERWFALEFSDGVYMVSMTSMRNCRNRHKSMTRDLATVYGSALRDWLWFRR